ncbi:MAG: hypothetical protein COB54_00095 [Alphaproteobacteria bacterium]|nr:MAG: hypothetical protein COB54_00095 [Alphaproteobacteria bacterium]
MPHYALSDGLVALCAIYGTVVLLRQSEQQAACRLIAGGFSVIALAALTGTWRFIRGNDALFEAPHLLFSDFAGISGFLWISLGLMGLITRLPVAFTWVCPLIGYGVLLALNLTIPALTVTSLFILSVQILSIIQMMKKKSYRPGVWHILSTLSLCGVLVIASIPPLNPDLEWHLYHVVLAAWALFLTLSVKDFLSEK